MRALLVVATLTVLAVVPSASAWQPPHVPEVQFIPCFAGGTSVVVDGQAVVTCFGGPGSFLWIERCDDGTVAIHADGNTVGAC